MKNKYLFVIVIPLSALGYLILNSLCDDTFPTIPFVTKWDISKKDSNIAHAFSVSMNRSYYFILSFRIPDAEKDISQIRPKLSEIVGDGSFQRPGISVPIHIKVEIPDVNKISQEATILDENVNTKSLVSSGTRNVDRKIAIIQLTPGKYVVTATTTEETSLPNWIETYLSVKERFLK